MYTVDTLRPGDIILTTEDPHEPWSAKLLDDAIRWSTVNPYCHAVFVGTDCLIEGLWQVTQSQLDKYMKTGWVFAVDGDSGAKATAIAWAAQHIGHRYGIAEILADGARYDAHWIPHWTPKHNFTCSGLVIAAYAAAGVTLTYAPFGTPADLSYSPTLIGPRIWTTPVKKGGSVCND